MRYHTRLVEFQNKVSEFYRYMCLLLCSVRYQGLWNTYHFFLSREFQHNVNMMVKQDILQNDKRIKKFLETFMDQESQDSVVKTEYMYTYNFHLKAKGFYIIFRNICCEIQLYFSLQLQFRRQTLFYKSRIIRAVMLSALCI